MSHVTVYVDQTIGKRIISTRFRDLESARKFAAAMKGTVRPPKGTTTLGHKLLAALGAN